MRTLSQKLEGAKRYVKHPDYKVGIDMLDEFITDAEKLEAQVKNLDLHSVNGCCTDGKHKRHITEKELKISAKEIRLQNGLIDYIINYVRKRQEKSGNCR